MPDTEADLLPMGPAAFVSLWFRYAFPKAYALLETVAGAWALLGGYVVSREPTTTDAVNAFAWQLPLLAFVVVFTWRGITAPYSMRQDVAVDRKRISDELAKRKANRAIADQLTEWRRRGQRIASMQLFLDEDATYFRDEAQAWLRDTLLYMREAGCTNQEHDALGDPTYSEYQRAPQFHEYPNEIWNELKRAHFLRLDILGRIIDAYSETPIFARR